MFPLSKLSEQQEHEFSQETGRAAGAISSGYEVERMSLKTCTLVKMEVEVLAVFCAFGCLPATLKSLTANVAAQIALWLHLWLKHMILQELHTGIPFGKGLLFWQGYGKSS